MAQEPTVYPNLFPERFPRERADATTVGATWGSAPSAEFEALAEGGEPLIYVVTVDRTLTISERMVGSRHAHHSVIASNHAVIAAGEVSLFVAGSDRVVLTLNERSGHYQPGRECLVAAREAFEQQGFWVPDAAVRPYNSE